MWPVLAQATDFTGLMSEVLKQGGLFAALCFLIWLTLKGGQKREDELKEVIKKNTDALEKNASAISANAVATQANTEVTRELKSSVVSQTELIKDQRRHPHDYEGPARHRR